MDSVVTDLCYSWLINQSRGQVCLWLELFVFPSPSSQLGAQTDRVIHFATNYRVFRVPESHLITLFC
jgi:hypothetical protein